MSWTGLIVGMAALALLTGGPATWRALRRAWSGRRLARARWLAGVVLVAVAWIAADVRAWRRRRRARGLFVLRGGRR